MSIVARTGRLVLFLFVALLYLADYERHGPTEPPPDRSIALTDFDILAARYRPRWP